MAAYYNEIDPYAAQWLRNLIAAGQIAPGDVDERSIEVVQPDDVRGYTQCHWFAGIGGWSYALRLAGWPDARSVWTGSCPCQPFSSAGKGAGFNDSRHLWPAWFRLIRECQPASVFGEQVASSDGIAWFDTVSTDLEAESYAIGATDLPAASVGAPHIRQRLWFMAHSEGEHRGLSVFQGRSFQAGVESIWRGEAGALDISKRRRAGREAGSKGRAECETSRDGQNEGRRQLQAQHSGAVDWNECEWLPCSDGVARAVEPGTFPLAHGIPQRVGRLRAYGNAIVPQVAAEFIGAYLDVIDGRHS
jgi:DNA (cytosine-5)-methyltransferase 1